MGAPRPETDLRGKKHERDPEKPLEPSG